MTKFICSGRAGQGRFLGMTHDNRKTAQETTQDNRMKITEMQVQN